MAKLDRRVIIQLNGQTVEFRYRRGPTSDRAVDLQRQNGIRQGMIRSFARAKEAAGAALAAFASHSSGGGGSATLLGQVLSSYFAGASAADDVARIADTFAAIRRGLEADIVISDELTGNAVEGVVDPRTSAGGPAAMKAATDQNKAAGIAALKRLPNAPAEHYLEDFAKGRIQHDLLVQLGTARTRNIHIAFRDCASKSVDSMARVIVHEASHKFGATGDVAYMTGGNAFKKMSSDLALINADSYAFAAIAMVRGQIVTDKTFSSEPKADQTGAVTGVSEKYDWIPGRKPWLGSFRW